MLDRGTTPHERTEAPLAEIVSAAMLLHAVSALLELGVVERLKEGPRDLRELALGSGAHEERLLAVLRPVAAAGLVHESAPGTFELTPAGRHLRRDDPLGLRDLFRMCTHGDFFQAWTRLARSVESGRTAFELQTGSDLFLYLAERPEEAELFHRAMNASAPADVLLEAADLSGARVVADLGGGEGATIAAVLRACPASTGVLFDLPDVVAGAGPLLRREQVADRCDVVAGDFFDGVPDGADVYVMARVLQNWPPEEAVRILRNVRAAMSGTSRLLVVGHLSESTRPSPFVEAIGLSMFVLYGAVSRTSEQYEALFAEAGLALSRTHRVRDGESVMDVRRA